MKDEVPSVTAKLCSVFPRSGDSGVSSATTSRVDNRRRLLDLAAAHPASVFRAIAEFGYDVDFRPRPSSSSASPPGSLEKLKTLAARVLAGEELWHPGDRRDYDEADPERKTNAE